jgi:hypothetical protein
MIVYLNGRFLPEEAAAISIHDRGFLYGDGLFEAIRVYDGEPFLWADHVERFRLGCEILRISSPLSPNELLVFSKEVLRRNQVANGLLRITLSRGPGSRGYSPKGADYPTLLVTAQYASYGSAGWILDRGNMKVVIDSAPDFAIDFTKMNDRRFAEQPTDMMAKPRSPQEMRYRELTRFIRALERSGGDANTLRVERALKIAIPITCIIIALFGAPLATSTQRGGAAYGVGISLAITVVFLMLIQLTKAIGGKGLIPPDMAAWIPSMIFGALGVVLLARVRT